MVIGEMIAGQSWKMDGGGIEVGRRVEEFGEWMDDGLRVKCIIQFGDIGADRRVLGKMPDGISKEAWFGSSWLDQV